MAVFRVAMSPCRTATRSASTAPSRSRTCSSQIHKRHERNKHHTQTNGLLRTNTPRGAENNTHTLTYRHTDNAPTKHTPKYTNKTKTNTTTCDTCWCRMFNLRGLKVNCSCFLSLLFTCSLFQEWSWSPRKRKNRRRFLVTTAAPKLQGQQVRHPRNVTRMKTRQDKTRQDKTARQMDNPQTNLHIPRQAVSCIFLWTRKLCTQRRLTCSDLGQDDDFALSPPTGEQARNTGPKNGPPNSRERETRLTPSSSFYTFASLWLSLVHLGAAYRVFARCLAPSSVQRSAGGL